jgi:hypothetical protein
VTLRRGALVLVLYSWDEHDSGLRLGRPISCLSFGVPRRVLAGCEHDRAAALGASTGCHMSPGAVWRSKLRFEDCPGPLRGRAARVDRLPHKSHLQDHGWAEAAERHYEQRHPIAHADT